MLRKPVPATAIGTAQQGPLQIDEHQDPQYRHEEGEAEPTPAIKA